VILFIKKNEKIVIIKHHFIDEQMQNIHPDKNYNLITYHTSFPSFTQSIEIE